MDSLKKIESPTTWTKLNPRETNTKALGMHLLFIFAVSVQSLWPDQLLERSVRLTKVHKTSTLRAEIPPLLTNAESTSKSIVS
jgi:hypothetical protein